MKKNRKTMNREVGIELTKKTPLKCARGLKLEAGLKCFVEHYE